MSVTNVTTGHAGSGEHWEPAVTPREAVKMGTPKEEYEPAALLARTTVEEHKRLGTARGGWEPTRNLNDRIAGPYLANGEQELASRLETEADPQLDEAQDLIVGVKASYDQLVEHARPISAPETGACYSVTEAVARVAKHDEAIERDAAAGKHHHHRASAALQRLAAVAPWLEAVGFLTFITYYLNVPLLEPWQDWLGWSFGLTVVVVIILGQTWLVRHAAKSHNLAREARADALRHEAEAGFERRNRYLWLTAVTSVAITSGMIWRGVAALGNASFGTTAVMVFVAVVTGLLLPTLAYLGIALDGSTVSRERDHLAAALDGDLDSNLETVSACRRDLADASAIGETLKAKTFPDICNTTQEQVDGVYEFYATVRLLIGGLVADPPAKTSKTIEQDPAGNITGYIGTSLPGTRTVNLGPLFDRARRLTELEAQGTDLLTLVDGLAPHPWGKSRTS